MKKNVLFMVAALLLCGAVSAQQQYAPNPYDYETNMPIVAQVTIDGVAPTTTGLELGAFKGEVVRGSAMPQPLLNNTYWIQVFFNESGDESEVGQPITFKLYDGENELTTEQTVNLSDEGEGTLNDPVVIDFATEQTQTIALATGWNWFSTYVDVSLEELQSSLVQALGTGNEITINARSGDISYYTGVRWRGELTSLDITHMYLIEAPDACEITLSGARVNPAAYEITITPGFNWISFLCNEEMDITTAFSSLAISGDMVVSSNGQSSTFNGSRWRGDLSVLEPGKGYIYESASNESRSFYYPTNSRVGDGSNIANRYETHWPDFNPNAYSLNLPVVAFVQIDGSYITSDDNSDALEVAAFVNGECRGHKFMVDETSDGDPYPYVSVPVYYTNTNEPVNFILYNHATGVEYVECVSNIEIFTGDKHTELYLDYNDAVVLNFASPTAAYTLDITGYADEGGNGSNWYLISTPVGQVDPATIEGMTTGDFDLFYFNQSDNGAEWKNYEANHFNLEPRKGYLYAHKTNVTLDFGTEAYTGSGDVTLVKDDNANLAGWNLIGNPFAVPSTIGRDFYVMKNDGTEIVTAETDQIAPMQGIFVVAERDGETVTFTPGAGTDNGNKLVINVAQNRSGVIDRAIVRFGQGGQLPKFMLNEDNTKIYIPQADDDYAVVRSDNEAEMPVNFKAAENGTYILKVDANNIEMDYLHLIDNMTGNDVDLLETPSYTFEANTTDYANRFKLVFDNSTTGIDENFAYYNNGNYIINNEGKATLQVIDILGHILSSEIISGNAHLTIDAAPGVYMLQLTNGNDVKTQKVIIK